MKTITLCCVVVLGCISIEAMYMDRDPTRFNMPFPHPLARMGMFGQFRNPFHRMPLNGPLARRSNMARGARMRQAGINMARGANMRQSGSNRERGSRFIPPRQSAAINGLNTFPRRTPSPVVMQRRNRNRVRPAKMNNVGPAQRMIMNNHGFNEVKMQQRKNQLSTQMKQVQPLSTASSMNMHPQSAKTVPSRRQDGRQQKASFTSTAIQNSEVGLHQNQMPDLSNPLQNIGSPGLPHQNDLLATELSQELGGANILAISFTHSPEKTNSPPQQTSQTIITNTKDIPNMPNSDSHAMTANEQTHSFDVSGNALLSPNSALFQTTFPENVFQQAPLHTGSGKSDVVSSQNVDTFFPTTYDQSLLQQSHVGPSQIDPAGTSVHDPVTGKVNTTFPEMNVQPQNMVFVNDNAPLNMNNQAPPTSVNNAMVNGMSSNGPGTIVNDANSFQFVNNGQMMEMGGQTAMSDMTGVGSSMGTEPISFHPQGTDPAMGIDFNNPNAALQNAWSQGQPMSNNAQAFDVSPTLDGQGQSLPTTDVFSQTPLQSDFSGTSASVDTQFPQQRRIDMTGQNPAPLNMNNQAPPTSVNNAMVNGMSSNGPGTIVNDANSFQFVNNGQMMEMGGQTAMGDMAAAGSSMGTEPISFHQQGTDPAMTNMATATIIDFNDPNAPLQNTWSQGQPLGNAMAFDVSPTLDVQGQSLPTTDVFSQAPLQSDFSGTPASVDTQFPQQRQIDMTGQNPALVDGHGQMKYPMYTNSKSPYMDVSGFVGGSAANGQGFNDPTAISLQGGFPSNTAVSGNSAVIDTPVSGIM